MSFYQLYSNINQESISLQRYLDENVNMLRSIYHNYLFFYIIAMGCQSSETRGQKYSIEKYQLSRYDYQKNPYRSIGVLTFLNRHNQKAKGTAVLISSNAILTAAANIYDQQNKEQYRNFKFYLSPSGKANIRSAYTLKTWKYIRPLANRESQDALFDYAIMISDEKIKRSFQGEHIKITMVCPQCTFKNRQNKVIDIQGYPSSSSNSNSLYTDNGEHLSGLYQYKFPVEIGFSHFSQLESRMKYEMKVYLVCQSGMAVTYNDKFVGLHFHTKNRGNKTFFSSLFNVSILKTLKKWLKQLGAAPFQINHRHICHHIQQQAGSLMAKQHPQEREVMFQMKIDQEHPFQGQPKQQYLQNNHQNRQGIPRQPPNEHKKQEEFNGDIDLLEKQEQKIAKITLIDHGLQVFDCSDNYNLQTLNLQNNKLKTIKLLHNKQLKYLNVTNNQLQQIDLSQNKAIQRLGAAANRLKRVLFCFRHSMAVDLGNQQSQKCNITVFCKAVDQQQCNRKIEELRNRYRIGGIGNKNGCQYVIKIKIG